MKTDKLRNGGKNISGQRISRARIAQYPEMSQAELSQCLTEKNLHLDQGIISRIENQARCVTDIELVAIAQCLHVSVAWLCGEKGKILRRKRAPKPPVIQIPPVITNR
jgi:Zn-finger nucleic acid-binding protein